MESTKERVIKVRKERTSTKSRKTSNATQNQKRQNSQSPQRRQQSKNKDGSKREDQNQKKARNSSPERVRCSAPENPSENGKSCGARGGEVTLTELIDCAVNVRSYLRFCVPPFRLSSGSNLFRSVFLVFCSCLPFRSFLTSCVAPSFPACSNHSTRNPGQQCLTLANLCSKRGKHSL
jgi:hypothetical protein